MVRLPADRRTDDEHRPRRVIWDGKPATARAITRWSADSSLIVRFHWTDGVHKPDEARTLVQHDFPRSAEWLPTPVGSTIERTSTDIDAPLTVTPPPRPRDPVEILEEK